MATAAQIAEVRRNTNEPTQDTWSDVEIGVLVDAGTVNSASVAVWTAKAAVYADLADRTEASASVKWSENHKKALSMIEIFEARDLVGVDVGKLPAKVHGIERQL